MPPPEVPLICPYIGILASSGDRSINSGCHLLGSLERSSPGSSKIKHSLHRAILHSYVHHSLFIYREYLSYDLNYSYTKLCYYNCYAKFTSMVDKEIMIPDFHWNNYICVLLPCPVRLLYGGAAVHLVFRGTFIRQVICEPCTSLVPTLSLRWRIRILPWNRTIRVLYIYLSSRVNFRWWCVHHCTRGPVVHGDCRFRVKLPKFRAFEDHLNLLQYSVYWCNSCCVAV